jgi:hypothetical protein
LVISGLRSEISEGIWGVRFWGIYHRRVFLKGWLAGLIGTYREVAERRCVGCVGVWGWEERVLEYGEVYKVWVEVR